MRRKAAHVAIALAFSLMVGAAPALAQDPSGSAVPATAICSVLTPDEITAAFGEALPITGSDESSCSWDSYATGGSASLSLSLTSGTIADIEAAYTDAVKDEIAGVPVLIASDGSFAFAEANGGILGVFVFVFDESVDVPATVRSMTAAALGRIDSIGLPVEPTLPPDLPEPSFIGDADLLALFPTTVGDLPLDIQTINGQELAGQFDPEDPDDQADLQALQDALANQGKTLDDLSVGFAFYFDAESSGGLTAVRVRGADIATFAEDLLPLLLTDVEDPQRTPGQIAGRDVTIVTDGPDGPDVPRQYIYPKDEVLWIVQADEPALTELFDQLP